MRISDPSSFLRRALLADAATSGAMGLLLLGSAGVLESLLGGPAWLLRASAAILIPFAALVTFVATRERIAAPAVWLVIGANALWIVDSVLLALSGWLPLTKLGVAFILAQAAVVLVFAELEYIGLRRSARTAIA